jgi:uncharacterized RDD family membrane protein YckC
MVYESLLLFGVVMIAALVYGVATGQRHALIGKLGLQLWLFAVLGLYFTWFWVRHGQTLAMRTWHIRVAVTRGGALSWPRAAARYALAWMWFAPALAAMAVTKIDSAGTAGWLLAIGVLAYALLARLHPSRQFWHDLLCGTRLVDTRVPKSTGADLPQNHRA